MTIYYEMGVKRHRWTKDVNGVSTCEADATGERATVSTKRVSRRENGTEA